MNTIVNGVEITPAIASALKDWLECPEDSLLALHIEWCNNIQDFICRVLVDKDYGTLPDEKYIKECLRKIMQIRKQLKSLTKDNDDQD